MPVKFKISPGQILTDTVVVHREALAQPAYDFEESKNHLLGRFKAVAEAVRALPPGACPDDYMVVEATLHPDRLSKADFPRHFLRYLGLTLLGSRKLKIHPRRLFKRLASNPVRRTVNLYLAGHKAAFAAIADKFKNIRPDSPASSQMACLETVNPPDLSNRVNDSGTSEVDNFEVALHLMPLDEDGAPVQTGGDQTDMDGRRHFPFRHFCAYAVAMGFTVREEYSFRSGGLAFVPVYGPRAKLTDLAKFVFVRQIQDVAMLRGLTPSDEKTDVLLSLPDQGPISGTTKVAILDGGLPDRHLISPWLSAYVKANPEAEDLKYGTDHGLAVTSSFLFGPMPKEGAADRPWAPVTVYRLIDSESIQVPGLQMFSALRHIQAILADGSYEFANISLGPDAPVRDGTVHAWTAVLDTIASQGKLFLTLAAGNNGDRDDAGGSRVQTPSDCVNAIGVGAADSLGEQWKRASYSAKGPGRSPAVVKPDLVTFGGEADNDFLTLTSGEELKVAGQKGTSFAAPYLLRQAVGLRVMGGDELSLLSIKALLIHHSERGGNAHSEVGWGRPPGPEEILNVYPGALRHLFQGRLEPGTFMRAELPRPLAGYSGPVKVRATFCYTPPVDSYHPSSYTKAALEIAFVPDFKATLDQDGYPAIKAFFDMDGGELDEDQDAEAVLWANVKCNENQLNPGDLSAPAFEVRQVDRGSGEIPMAIEYSLVIDVWPTPDDLKAIESETASTSD
jgi:hypothetical protein